MILSFTDLHLGLKHQSKQEGLGLYTSEIEAYKCLDYIYDYCADSSNQIDLVIFKGDWFHNNTPSAIHYKKTINWLKRFNSLNIKLLMIPGNHSSNVFSNCLSFIHELHLENVILFDCLDELNHFSYKEYNIYLVPYVYSESMKERDINVESIFKQTIAKITTQNNIIVGHLQEVSAKVGSESIMIAKGVEFVDVDDLSNISLILLGHIHKQQMYTKNGVPIVYSGSTYFQDKSDVNQSKGFSVIADPANIKFVSIPNLRKYHKVVVNPAIINNLDSLFKNRKLNKDDVIYFDCSDIDRTLIVEETLQSKCVEYSFWYGGVSYQADDSDLGAVSVELGEEDTPQVIFKTWLNAQEGEKDFLDAVYTKGLEYIENYYKV